MEDRMRLRILLTSFAIAGLLAVPGMATADWDYDECCCLYGYDYGSKWHAYDYGYGRRTAVAGYSSMDRHPSMRALDNARIAEYREAFGMYGGGSRVAGYTSWRPWMEGGTWVTVNGQRIWATPDDFVWSNNRWTWSDNPSATVMFEDPHYRVTNRTWYMTTTWNPWMDGGTWVTVNGDRIWASE